jgi:hypothetical protein
MTLAMDDDLERLNRLLDDLAAERDPRDRAELSAAEVELAQTAAFLKAAHGERSRPTEEFSVGPARMAAWPMCASFIAPCHRIARAGWGWCSASALFLCARPAPTRADSSGGCGRDRPAPRPNGAEDAPETEASQR